MVAASRVELSFVLPAYNEAGSIESSLSLLEGVVRAAKVSYEVVVVDDGSVDETALRAVNYASRNGHVRVVTYGRNVGKGYAVKRGFMRAVGDAVVFVDSDLEVDFGRVSEYVEALGRGDIVVASKWHPGSVVDVPFLRRFLSFGFHVLVRLLTGVRVRDTQAGLKALRRSAFVGIFPRLAVKRFAFDVELLALANLYGLRVVEMPVTIRMRRMFGFGDAWRMFVDLLGIAYRLRVVRWYQRSLRQ